MQARGTAVAQVPLPFADARALTAVEALMSATANLTRTAAPRRSLAHMPGGWLQSAQKFPTVF